MFLNHSLSTDPQDLILYDITKDSLPETEITDGQMVRAGVSVT